MMGGLPGSSLPAPTSAGVWSPGTSQEGVQWPWGHDEVTLGPGP